MKIFAVIVTYNGEKWIDQCFSSLERSSVPLQIIAVDNASSDQTVPAIKKNFPAVRTIEAGKNLGFGKANNVGLKIAAEEKADYVFLLNQDAYVAADCIEKLIAVSKKNPEYGVLSPIHLNYEGTASEKYFNDFVIDKYTAGFRADENSGNLKQLYSSAFIHAAGWLMPMKAIETVGGFDPLFFHYGEDNDYILRLQRKGFFAGIVPEAIMYHQGTNEGLTDPHDNYRFKENFTLLRFKNPAGSVKGNLLLLFRNSFKESMKALFTLQFSRLRNEVRYSSGILIKLGRIKASRKEQETKFAYLR